MEIPGNPENLQPKPQVEMSRNTLVVDGKVLDTTTSPEFITRILTENQSTILEGLERFREEIQRQNPDAEVTISPFVVMRLGEHPKNVFADKSHRKEISTSISDLQERLRPYWRAVEASKLRPDVRLYGHYSGWYDVNLWANYEQPIER